jgi:uncharacterized protein YbaR (Trm112 family)
MMSQKELHGREVFPTENEQPVMLDPEAVSRQSEQNR